MNNYSDKSSDQIRTCITLITHVVKTSIKILLFACNVVKFYLS